MTSNSSNGKGIGYSGYVYTWLGLLVLTALTVTVAGMQLKWFSIITALIIASVKAILVLNIFMHLKYERGFFKIAVIIVVITLTVFIGFTFFDVLYR